jgi:hypothetical protein
MLHRIQLPDCAPQLEKIRQFQRDVLAFACDEKTVVPITQEALQDSLGNERGNWLWKKLRKQRGEPGETAFHLALIAVIVFVQEHPEQRQTILDAFDHDVTFHMALNDPNFYFQYLALSEDAQKVIKSLMISFYEDFLAAGFETEIHGLLGKLEREKFIASFWDTNQGLEVCPACDERRADVIDEKHFEDADHCLPKSIYPFLSLHSLNLVPLCVQCNRLFKGDRDPIDNHNDAPLVNSFHPYLRPALEHISIQINNEKSGVRQVVIKEQDGSVSRRVESLKRVFKLHKRWPDELRYQVEDLRDQISDIGRRNRRSGAVWEDQQKQFRFELEEMLKKKSEKLGKRVGYVLQTSYLYSTLNDQSEFEELLRYFEGSPNP